MKKVLLIFLWVFLFPFMLTYWGWKNKKKPVVVIGAILTIGMLIIGGQSDVNETPSTSNVIVDEKSSNESAESPSQVQEDEAVIAETETTTNTDNKDIAVPVVENKEVAAETPVNNNVDTKSDLFEGYRLIEVDGGDLSGHREPNVVVDIGFGDREYYAFTNEYGQLVKVIAKEIILQDEKNEPVLSTGRYYRDEAKVPGVESKYLDEGHVIADSLGGVSNAYNITPQNSTLNRHGDQAYMEKAIRDAGGCTDFTAIITYPNTETQIPSHYSYTYTLKGNVIHDEFDNVNPDEVNAELNNKKEPAATQPVQKEPASNGTGISITTLDKVAEYIVIENKGSEAVNLSGWEIVSVTGNQRFTFGDFVLKPNSRVKVGDSDKNSDVDFHWMEGKGVWNNSKSDPAELYNDKGQLVYRYDD